MRRSEPDTVGMQLRSRGGSRDHVREGGSDGSVTISGGVLIQEGGTHRGVTHAGHQLLGAGPGGGGHRVPRVTQVVKVHPLHSSGPAGFAPLDAPPGAGQRCTSLTGEHQGLRINGPAGGQVGFHLGQEVWWDGYGAPTSLGLSA